MAYPTGPGAVTCRACSAPIPPDDALVVCIGYNRGFRSGDPVCLNCANSWHLKISPGLEWRDYLHNCLSCGRIFYGSLRRLYCCEKCGDRYRQARRRRPKALPQLVRCESCGREFEPSRADGRYCSSACRQRAYRVRLREVAA